MKRHALYLGTMIAAVAAVIIFPDAAHAADPIAKLEDKGSTIMDSIKSFWIPTLCTLGLVSCGVAWMFNKGRIEVLRNVAIGLSIVLLGDLWLSFFQG